MVSNEKIEPNLMTNDKMDIFRNYYNVIATVLFISTIAIAQFFATNGYQWTKNTISDLGSQGYDRKFIMQFGFLAFGIIMSMGIIIRGFNWRTAPILMYALCVGLTGFFCTKPFLNLEDYSETQSRIHSALAQIAGFFFTLGILIQGVFSDSKMEKWGHFSFFLLVVGLSVSFGLVKNYQGVLQRILYLTSFIWLIKLYRH